MDRSLHEDGHEPALARVRLPAGTAPGRLAAGICRLARGALDAVLPGQCLACEATVPEPGTLCGACWGAADFIAAPYCARCGTPFAYDLGADAWCAACVRAPPAFERARAVMRYDELARRLITGFKHGDRTHGAPAYGRWLARAGAALLGEADLVAPVPLHWRRLWRRRFNQSAMLALAAAGAAGRSGAVVPDLLVRRRATASQGGLGAAARGRNVAGAFALDPRRAELVAGRRVLLVDDVLTTGATAEACARTLLRAGACAVDVLVLARVERPR